MSVIDIVESIQAKAKIKQEEVLSNWKIDIAKINSNNDEVISQRSKELTNSYEAFKVTVLEKSKSIAILEWKNKVLKSKHNLIDKIFRLWKEKALYSMGSKYQNMLVRLLMWIKEDSWEIIAWKWHKATINEAVQLAKKWFKITWEWDFVWWFKLSTSVVDYDFSFDNLFNNLKKEKEFEIANRLFTNV